jgi:ABC-type antimicrobial peptide transport system permease subunit
MIKDGLHLAGIGLILGTVLSVVVTRIMSGLLFGVRGVDPLIHAVTFVSLGMVVLLACLIPSIRATRLDLVIALRCE